MEPFLVESTRGKGHKQLARRADPGKTRRKIVLTTGARVLPGRRIFLSQEEFDANIHILAEADRAGILEVKKLDKKSGNYLDVDFTEDHKMVPAKAEPTPPEEQEPEPLDDGEEEEEEIEETPDYSSMTKAELLEECEEQGLEVTDRMTKAELVAKLGGS